MSFQAQMTSRGRSTNYPPLLVAATDGQQKGDVSRVLVPYQNPAHVAFLLLAGLAPLHAAIWARPAR